MVELVTPWLITLCLGFLVFLYGEYFAALKKNDAETNFLFCSCVR